MREVGRQGKAKVRVVGYDVFSNKRLEEIYPNTATMVECPRVDDRERQLADMSVDEMDPTWYRVTVLDDYGKEMVRLHLLSAL